MNIEELQNKVLNFIPKIVGKIPETKVEKSFKRKGTSGEREVIDLSHKVAKPPILIQQYFSDLSEKKMFYLIGKKEYGFSNEEDYRDFYRFIYDLLACNNYQEKVSVKYLKEKVLLWVVNVHINNMITENFTTYLYRIIEEDVNKYTFYFPILNMEIEKEFNVGSAKITYFSKQFLDELYHQKFLKEMTKEVFLQSFGKFHAKALVVVDVLAEKELANDLATIYSSYAVDVLKLTTSTVAIPFQKCYLELESKMPFSYEYISTKDDDFGKFSYHVGINREHEMNYTVDFIDSWNELFSQFGDLIKNKDEKSLLITNSIIHYSKCLSENDLHLRVSKLIMILESIFLKKEERNGMVAKCKKRFLNFRFENNNEKQASFETVLDNMYQIRHKMTHKSIRLFIDNNELREFQQEIIHILFLLSKLKSTNFDKEEFLDYLGNKESIYSI